ncbi:MAG: chemotaxis protein CheW [Planctomycetota bacterium]
MTAPDTHSSAAPATAAAAALGADASLQALKAAFDRSFAQHPAPPTTGQEHLLAVRIGGDPYALRVADIVAIAHAGRIVPVPSPTPELVGLSGLRGELIALYHLGMLLGYPRGSAAPRWFVQVGDPDTIGLVFDRFEGYLLADATQRSAPAVGQPRRDHIDEVIRLGAEVHSVISIDSVLKTVRKLVEAGRSKKE